MKLISKEPPYGYVDCGFPGCKGKMALHFDLADFTFSRKCRSCRVKMSTHDAVGFCKHGNPVTHLTSFPEPSPTPCGCDDSDMSEITFDWVARRPDR